MCAPFIRRHAGQQRKQRGRREDEGPEEGAAPEALRWLESQCGRYQDGQHGQKFSGSHGAHLQSMWAESRIRKEGCTDPS